MIEDLVLTKGVGLSNNLPEVQEEFVPDVEPITVVEETDDLGMTSEELRKEVLIAKDNIESSYMKLCQYLYVVQRKEYWRSWGFASFKEYLAREIVFKKSKAFRLIQLWENLYIRQSDKTILQRMLSDVGWTKAVSLMYIINSENADEWIEKARHLNVEELEVEVKKYLKSLKPSDPEETEMALEMGEAIEGRIESTEPQRLSFEFVDFQDYLVVVQALDTMKKMEPTLSNSQSLANICREFIGSNNPSEDRKASIVEWMIKFESQFGLKLVIIDEQEQSVLYGYDYLASLSQK